MTGVELHKQLFRMRTYVSLLVMAGIPTIMVIAFEITGGPKSEGDRDLFELATRSGLNMPLAALAVMSNFLLPVVVVNIAAGSVAEEASWGSLRYLLLRPVGRGHLLLSKLVVTALLAVLATFVIVLVASIEGVVAFGWHPVLAFSRGGIVSIEAGTALARLIIGALYVTWSLSGIMAFAFMLSTFTDAPLGALVGGMGLAVVSFILDILPPLDSINNVFPSHYLHAWEALYATPPRTHDLLNGALVQVPYVVGFLAIGWWWFHRKDILS